MRTITVVQGVVIITAAAYLNEKGHFDLSIIVGVFGLLFTLVLSQYHRKYMKLADAENEYLQRLETEFSPPDHPDGPCLAFEQARMSVRHQKLDRFLLNHGTSSLILVALLGVISYDCCRILELDACESPNKVAAANRSGLSQPLLPTTPPPSPLAPPPPTPAAAAPALRGR
jgi:hypothetical protein